MAPFFVGNLDKLCLSKILCDPDLIVLLHWPRLVFLYPGIDLPLGSIKGDAVPLVGGISCERIAYLHLIGIADLHRHLIVNVDVLFPHAAIAVVAINTDNDASRIADFMMPPQAFVLIDLRRC